MKEWSQQTQESTHYTCKVERGSKNKRAGEAVCKWRFRHTLEHVVCERLHCVVCSCSSG